MCADGALALLQSAAEQAYRRTASDPTNFASGSAAAAVAAIAAEARPKQTVSTGAPSGALPTGTAAQRPPPSNTVSTGAPPPAASMDMVAAALGLIPNPSVALLDSVATMANAVAASPAASPTVAHLPQVAPQQPAPAAGAEVSTTGITQPAAPTPLVATIPPGSAAAMQQNPATLAVSTPAPRVVVAEGLRNEKAYLLDHQQEPATDAAPVAPQMAADCPSDQLSSLPATQQEPAVPATPVIAPTAVEGAEDHQADPPAGKADPDVLQSEI